MKKRILCILMIFFILMPLLVSAAPTDSAVLARGSTGSDIYAVQRRLRDLGYLNYRPTGKFSDMTSIAVRTFQQVNGITPDGQIGASTMDVLFSDSAKRNAPNPEFKKVSGKAYSGEIKDKATLSSWETIDKLFPVGGTATIKDYNTGTTFSVKRVGGVKSAQVTAESADDYDSYAYIFGGQTWEHRTVLVTIGDTQYAASLFGQPTGINPAGSSGMPGSTTLYFNNSKTDINSLSDEEHILAISRAS